MARVCIIFALALASLVGGAGSAARVNSPAGVEVTGYFKEVKMRKMYIMRPDLIPYPIVQEFYA